MAVTPPQQPLCPRCQHPVPPNATVCPNCGQALAHTRYGPSSSGASPADAPQPPAPDNPPASFSAPQGSHSGPAGVAGTLVATDAPARRRSHYRFTVVSLIIVLALVVAAGYLLYLRNLKPAAATPPTPTITVTSQYHVGAIPAGANGTPLQVSGQHFTANSRVTFLLLGDTNTPVEENVPSDANGQVQQTLPISDWPLGTFTFAARDAQGRQTAPGVTIVIVSQGEAMTPGPNGSPYDSQSFAVTATVSPADAVTGDALPTFSDDLSITGQPDPAGGTVCDTQNDTGQPVTQTGTSSGVNYIITFIAKCSGTYKGGMLTYTETASSYKIAFANGVTCLANVPFVSQTLTGSFTDATTISGTYSTDALILTCNNGTSTQNNPQKGTWSGDITG